MLVANRGAGEEVIATLSDVPDGRVLLKVSVCGQTRTFYFSTDNGATWLQGGVVENCTFLSDEGNPNERKRHTGTLTGLYANNGGCGSRIPADFDYFRMSF